MGNRDLEAEKLLAFELGYLRDDLQLDWMARYVNRLPTHENIGRYLGLDVRLGWKLLPDLEIVLASRNLLDDHHPEFQALFIDTLPTETRRSAYGAVTCKF